VTRLHRIGARHDHHPVVEVLVCRGCCCGSLRKHPDVDHDAQLERLRDAAAAAPVPTRLRTVDCLSACAMSNVVVVRRRAPRDEGGRASTLWFALVLDDEVVDALAGWVAAGAAHPAPDVVRRHAMPAPRARV
jgi:predicted metal-binding protein